MDAYQSIGNPAPIADSGQSRRNNSQESGAVAAAFYIVGCLAAAGAINVDIDSPLAGNEIISAIQIVAANIIDMGLWRRGQGMPDQPAWHGINR